MKKSQKLNIDFIMYNDDSVIPKITSQNKNIARINMPAKWKNIDDNSNRKRCLGSRNGYGKEGEEHTLGLLGIEKTVEYHKVDVDGIEHELERHQHSNHIFACDEAVDSAAEHNQRGQKIVYSCNFHSNQRLRATTTPPIIHASNRTDTASNGSRYWPSPVPMRVEPSCCMSRACISGLGARATDTRLMSA